MILWWFYDDFMIKEAFLRSMAKEKSPWEVKIKACRVCRTCKRKVGCCGRRLGWGGPKMRRRLILMRKIGMKDRLLGYQFRDKPRYCPQILMHRACDLKEVASASVQRSIASIAESHMNGLLIVTRKDRKWIQRSDSQQNVCVWWFQPIIFVAPVHFPVLVGCICLKQPNLDPSSACLQALEFIPNSVRLWKEAVSLEAPLGWSFCWCYQRRGTKVCRMVG